MWTCGRLATRSGRLGAGGRPCQTGRWLGIGAGQGRWPLPGTVTRRRPVENARGAGSVVGPDRTPVRQGRPAARSEDRRPRRGRIAGRKPAGEVPGRGPGAAGRVHGLLLARDVSPDGSFVKMAKSNARAPASRGGSCARAPDAPPSGHRRGHLAAGRELAAAARTAARRASKKMAERFIGPPVQIGIFHANHFHGIDVRQQFAVGLPIRRRPGALVVAHICQRVLRGGFAPVRQRRDAPG